MTYISRNPFFYLSLVLILAIGGVTYGVTHAGTFQEPTQQFPDISPNSFVVEGTDVSQGVPLTGGDDGSGHLNRDGAFYVVAPTNSSFDVTELAFGNALSFRDYDAGANGTSRLYIDGNGNIGIGVTNPGTAQLEIGGTSAAAVRIDNGGDLVLGSTTLYNDHGYLVVNNNLDAPGFISSGNLAGTNGAAYFPQGISPGINGAFGGEVYFANGVAWIYSAGLHIAAQGYGGNGVPSLTCDASTEGAIVYTSYNWYDRNCRTVGGGGHQHQSCNPFTGTHAFWGCREYNPAWWYNGLDIHYQWLLLDNSNT